MSPVRLDRRRNDVPKGYPNQDKMKRDTYLIIGSRLMVDAVDLKGWLTE
jgi:hypothetical protein